MTKPKTKPATKAPAGDALEAMILEKAAKPGGFAMIMASTNSSRALKLCHALIDAGKLFRAAPTKVLVRYFATEEAATEFKRAELQRLSTKTVVVGRPKEIKPVKAAPAVDFSRARVTICPAHHYEPLNMADVMRDCARGSARQGSRAWGGEVVQ